MDSKPVIVMEWSLSAKSEDNHARLVAQVFDLCRNNDTNGIVLVIERISTDAMGELIWVTDRRSTDAINTHQNLRLMLMQIARKCIAEKGI